MEQLPPQEPPPPPPPPAEAPYWTPAQPPPRGSSRNLVVIGAIAAVLVILVAAIGAYAVIGHSVASSRIDSADAALSSARSHEADFAQSMSTIGNGFGAAAENESPSQYKASVDQLSQTVSREQATVSDDRSKVDAAGSRLHDSALLTMFYRDSLDHESQRIGHADKALDAAKTMADDFAQDASFYGALADAIVDLGDLGTRSQAGDLAGANAAVTKFKADADKGVSLSGAPGMPDEVHRFMVDFQAVAGDFQAYLNAAETGNASAFNAAKAKIASDLAALKSIDMTGASAKIEAFYQPYVTTYNEEMHQASA